MKVEEYAFKAKELQEKLDKFYKEVWALMENADNVIDDLTLDVRDKDDKIEKLEDEVTTLRETLEEAGDPDKLLIADDLQEEMILPLLTPLLQATDYHKVKRFIETFPKFEQDEDS
jgi:predicted RNase H-like nuclease (RuvC/YqgF family)